MLSEFEGLSQEHSGFRRLFTDRYFDLYLWYEYSGGPLSGFQLCYDMGNDPHALTVRIGGSSIHTRIDEGEGGAMEYKGSPILVSDGAFEKDEVLRRFQESSFSLEPGLRDIVLQAVQGHRD